MTHDYWLYIVTPTGNHLYHMGDKTDEQMTTLVAAARAEQQVPDNDAQLGEWDCSLTDLMVYPSWQEGSTLHDWTNLP